MGYKFKHGDRVTVTSIKLMPEGSMGATGTLLQREGVKGDREFHFILVFDAKNIRGAWPSNGYDIEVTRHASKESQQCWYVSSAALESSIEVIPKTPTAPMALSVLQILQRKGSLTSMEAGGMLKCRDLPKRISELRALGWPIMKQLKRDPHDKQRYMRYHLAAA